MNTVEKETKVVRTENTSQGVVVTFSNGECVLFHHHFLYEVRQQDGNIALVNEGGNEN